MKLQDLKNEGDVALSRKNCRRVSRYLFNTQRLIDHYFE